MTNVSVVSVSPTSTYTGLRVPSGGSKSVPVPGIQVDRLGVIFIQVRIGTRRKIVTLSHPHYNMNEVITRLELSLRIFTIL